MNVALKIRFRTFETFNHSSQRQALHAMDELGFSGHYHFGMFLHIKRLNIFDHSYSRKSSSEPIRPWNDVNNFCVLDRNIGLDPIDLQYK